MNRNQTGRVVPLSLCRIKRLQQTAPGGGWWNPIEAEKMR
jgi:hypothetical protein